MGSLEVFKYSLVHFSPLKNDHLSGCTAINGGILLTPQNLSQLCMSKMISLMANDPTLPSFCLHNTHYVICFKQNGFIFKSNVASITDRMVICFDQIMTSSPYWTAKIKVYHNDSKWPLWWETTPLSTHLFSKTFPLNISMSVPINFQRRLIRLQLYWHTQYLGTFRFHVHSVG